MQTKISSKSKEVIIGSSEPVVMIGERINPTGRKKLAESLKKGDMRLVQAEALAQVAAGAQVLDVNVGVSGTDEKTLLLSDLMLGKDEYAMNFITAYREQHPEE